MSNQGIDLDRLERSSDPANQVTRAEAISLLHRMAGFSDTLPLEEWIRSDLYPERELINVLPQFPDVSDQDWFEEAVDWAKEQEILWWSSPDPFQPDHPVTRAEAAVYLHRFHRPPPLQPLSRSFLPWL